MMMMMIKLFSSARSSSVILCHVVLCYCVVVCCVLLCCIISYHIVFRYTKSWFAIYSLSSLPFEKKKKDKEGKEIEKIALYTISDPHLPPILSFSYISESVSSPLFASFVHYCLVYSGI